MAGTMGIMIWLIWWTPAYMSVAGVACNVLMIMWARLQRRDARSRWPLWRGTPEMKPPGGRGSGWPFKVCGARRRMGKKGGKSTRWKVPLPPHSLIKETSHHHPIFPQRGPGGEAGRERDAPGGAAVGWNRLLRYNTHMAVDLVGGLVCLRCGDTAGRASLRQRWLGAPCREELRPAAMPRRVISALNLQPNAWRSRLSPPKAERVSALLVSEVGGATGAVGGAGMLRWQHLGM